MALETLRNLPDIDTIVCSVGVGGLLAGIAAAGAEQLPVVHVFAAEPLTASPFVRIHGSWTAGKPG